MSFVTVRSGNEVLGWAIVFLGVLALTVLNACESPTDPKPDGDFVVFGGHLTNGFDLGVESSEERRDWVEVANGEMHMSYPSGQEWGTVFIVCGLVTDPPRPSLNFSEFSKIALTLRGISDQSVVRIGIKDRDDPDDGSEDLELRELSREWEICEFDLDRFRTASLERLYVVAEFVFRGPNAEIVWCCDIRFVP